MSVPKSQQHPSRHGVGDALVRWGDTLFARVVYMHIVLVL